MDGSDEMSECQFRLIGLYILLEGRKCFQWSYLIS